MKKLFYLCIIIGSFTYTKCSEIRTWDDPVDEIPPGNITNAVVKNLPGSALITYDLPSDDDLLGVRAVYKFYDNGETIEFFASAFTDSLLLEGFPDTNERTVYLVCLDKSRNESVPVEVKVNPQTLPVELVRRSLMVKETYGGVYVSWENEYREDIGISLYASDSNDELIHNYTYFTNQVNGNYSFRGFDDLERKFTLQIRDKWDRYSTSLDTVLKPHFEIQISAIDATGIPLWKRYGVNDGSWAWRGDINPATENQSFEKIFDKDYGSNSGYWHTGTPGNMLGHFTGNQEDNNTPAVPIYWIIDLGRECILGRHKKWDRMARPNDANNYRYYEIWATNDKPKGPGDFSDKWESLKYWTDWAEVGGTGQWKNDWVKIAVCECIPPSGAKSQVDVTEEDNQWTLANGYEFDIYPEHNTTPFRYLRICADKTWGNSTITHIGEFEFWGNYIE